MTRRIVSLLPSATEVLFALGLGDQVVGVTYECTVPAEAAIRPHVTDTIIPTGATPGEIDSIIKAAVADGKQLYELHADILRSLEPDLIVTQDLCRVCALPAGQVDQALQQIGCEAEVFSYDPMTLDQVLNQIEALALVAGADPVLAEQLRQRLEIQRQWEPARRPTVLLLEWVDPPFTPGHWIPDQIEAAGGVPLLGHPGERSEGRDWADIAESGAEVMLIAPCGFDAEAAEQQLQTVLDRTELANLPAVRDGRVYALDGDSYVVRPGPRLLDGIDVMKELIHR